MIYFIIAILLLAVISYFIFKSGKTKAAVLPAQEKLDDRLLEENVSFYRNLGLEDKSDFVRRLEAFLQETHIEGVGFELEDLDRVLIASSAVIPIFGFKEWHYPQLTNILLYPDTFNNDFQFEGGKREILGMVGGGFMNGQMLLSQVALRQGFSASAGTGNTAIHEFVHLLDKEDGATDGVPEHFLAHEYAVPWIKMIHQEIRKIEDGKSEINPYATTNEAEFFAVVSEYFFEKPEQLKSKHPELYEMLAKIFMQDPA